MKNCLFTPEMEKFIYDHYKTYTTKELTKMFNEKFGTDKTWHQIRSFRRKHNLNSQHLQGTANQIFPQEIKEFIFANYKGTGYQEMVRLIWREFEVAYTAKQIRSFYRNNKLNSGLKGNVFQKGECKYPTPKGICYSGCEKTWFKKGNKPSNYVPVGTERIRPSNGYVWVKIAEPKKWRMKHLLVWEAANGPVPKGYKLYFRDGNPENCSLENLILVEQRVFAVMNIKGLSQYKGELADAAVNTARLQLAVNDAKRRKKKAGDSANG